MEKVKEKAFVIHKENGFVLNLPNGIRISTIFGYGSYTENYDCEISGRVKEGSDNVEIMISCSDKKWLKRINKKYSGDSNAVIGYITIDKWFKILKECWRLKPKQKKVGKFI